MAKFENLMMVTALIAFIAVGGVAFAQDDLDDLLKDLESDTVETSTTAQAGEPAAEVPVAQKAEAEETPAARTDAPEPEAEKDAPAEKTEAAREVAREAAAESPETAPAKVQAPEKIAEETAVDERKEEAPASRQSAEPAPAVAEQKSVSSKVNDALNLLDELAAEDNVEDSSAVAQTGPAKQGAASAAKQTVARPANPDAELLANIRATEKLRRQAYDAQARREIDEARRAMSNEDYRAAVRHYGNAANLLNGRLGSADMRRECEQGVAEGLYRAAMQEDRTGRRDRALKLMEKAIDMCHPRARQQYEQWIKEGDPAEEIVDVAAISHRRNAKDYKDAREKNLRHLKRARQYLATRELDKALDECELVLVSDPYNQEAIRVRNAIQKKRRTILKQERAATREGMIADVDEAWRPVYAVDAREIADATAQTLKSQTGEDSERSVEQSIIKRMKEMRLPSISFKPPATIIDAVEFFRTASKDYDRPDIPVEQRGFNFVLKTPNALQATATEEPAEEASGFGSDDESAQPAGQAGVPVIPMIAVSNISFYDALKQVCELVGYKFKVQGSIVIVMHKNASTDEMVTRSYPVLSSFMDRMTSASSDMKEMKSSGFGGGSSRDSEEETEGNQEKDWKEFFSLLGVQWPEGSSIMYIKTIGKLRVKNTYENLAELEQALTEMNADPKLIEIEARFVEVCQEDLNSLGFEWILNGDYSIGHNARLGKVLGLGGSAGTGGNDNNEVSTQSFNPGRPIAMMGGLNGEGGQNTFPDSSGSSGGSSGGNSGGGSGGNSGGGMSTATRGIDHNTVLSAFGGDADYSNGNRYLSTVGNHISGESKSTNDRFMRLNAFLGSADLSMILHMLAQRSDTDLLSAPKVLTRPGEEAVIKVVTEYIYPTDYDVQLQSSSSSSSGSSGSSQSAILAVVEPQSFTMREVGVILDVTPTLTDDGNLIDLKLNTQVVDEPTWKNYGMRIPFTGNASSLQSFAGIGDIFSGLSDVFTQLGTGLTEEMKQTFAQSASDAATSALENLTKSGSENITYYDAPMEQPFFHVRSIDSNVSVYPGATIVMGGLITEARKAMDDKVPFLGDIPFIGRFFRSHSEWTSKRNLLIFVTTRLVDVHGREVALGAIEEESANVKPAPAAAK